jgi:hypothetical protein
MTDMEIQALARATADKFWNGTARLETYIEAAIKAALTPKVDLCWWCGKDYDVGVHSMEFGCTGMGPRR